MLDLRGFGLQGQLPPLSGLEGLQALSLEDNQGLTGPLPDGFAQLGQLLWLSVKVGSGRVQRAFVCMRVYVCGELAAVAVGQGG